MAERSSAMIVSGLKSSATVDGAVSANMNIVAAAKPVFRMLVVSFVKVSERLPESLGVHGQPGHVFLAETAQDVVCSLLRRPRILPAPHPPQELCIAIHHIAHQVVIRTKIELEWEMTSWNKESASLALPVRASTAAALANVFNTRRGGGLAIVRSSVCARAECVRPSE